jgi:hypothetical protein
MESINVLKLQIKVLENQIEREFGGKVWKKFGKIYLIMRDYIK